MQKIKFGLISLAGLVLFQTAGIAQEYEGCFLRDRSGNLIKLTDMCPTSSQEGVSATLGAFQVPIKRRASGIPVIDVIFNGNQTFEMMLDTGASGTVITPKMAQALGVKQDGTARVETPNAKNVEFPIGRVTSIKAGNAVINNVAVAISPTLEIGLLGQDFFSKYDVTIKKEVIEFNPQTETATPGPAK
ncbi:MAG: retroviral-like aspartic protease family protein [Microcoleus vaginatus WJT46-NPBG5]|jgi:aspartyl protease family protein|nr:retroviral-like aspartic protease family protein [Microcoleus vaginatus WJT46-NPBG5]